MERTYNRFKYTVDPNGNGFVGDINKAIEMNGKKGESLK
jgi:hypothetical protein